MHLLTVRDIQDKKLSCKFWKWYDMAETDDFIDEVEKTVKILIANIKMSDDMHARCDKLFRKLSKKTFHFNDMLHGYAADEVDDLLDDWCCFICILSVLHSRTDCEG